MKNALIINLSTLYDYSSQGFVDALVQLCNAHSEDIWVPQFFQPITNKLWVEHKIQMNSSLIQNYDAGLLDTEKFLDELSTIFDFLNHMSKEEQHALLKQAFTSRIGLTGQKTGRLPDVVDLWAKNDAPIYIITNSNPMDIEAIVALFRNTFGHVIKFSSYADLNATLTFQSVELAKNVYLCTAHQFKALKDGEDGSTMSLLDMLVAGGIDERGRLKATGIIPLQPGNITLVSQHAPDLEKGRQLGMQVTSAEDYFAHIEQLKKWGEFSPSYTVALAASSQSESFASSSTGPG